MPVPNPLKDETYDSVVIAIKEDPEGRIAEAAMYRCADKASKAYSYAYKTFKQFVHSGAIPKAEKENTWQHIVEELELPESEFAVPVCYCPVYDEETKRLSFHVELDDWCGVNAEFDASAPLEWYSITNGELKKLMTKQVSDVVGEMYVEEKTSSI